MHKHDTFLAIIPARKGSKGIPGKNLQKIGKKPMLQYTIEAARSTISPKNIIISSDDPSVFELLNKIGIDAPFKRPDNLSTESAKTSDVVLHSLEWYQSQYNDIPSNIVVLQPTSPFRDAKDIDCAIEKFKNSNKKTLVSVSEPLQHPGDCVLKDSNGQYKRLEIAAGHVQRQSYPEVFFIDGGIYISDTKNFIQTHDLIGDDPEIFKMDQSHSLDIDSPFDLEIARALNNYNQ